MNRRELLTTTMAAVIATSAMPVRAGTANKEGLIGSWLGTVTATEPQLGQFNDLISFHAGGVVTESRRYAVETPFGKLLETTGHGAWEARGDNTFEAFFRFLLQHADTGEAFGTDNIRLLMTLDESTDTVTGTFHSQIKDMSDNVMFAVTGPYSATRISV